MNKKLLINLIKSNVNEINKIVEDLNENTVVPVVFYELTLSKIRNLYVQFKLFQEGFEISENFKELVADISQVLVPEKPDIENNAVTQFEHVVEKQEETQTATEYEKIIKLREQDFLSVQINFNPIKSIAAAIDLNDKIWFTKTLFNGNLNFFNTTVEKLNQFEYLEEAIDFLDANFDWEYQNNTVRKFFQYVFMRYA